MFEVIIVGAGPVGLCLSALLIQQGITVRILEQRTVHSSHSRAIGIHPPGLAVLAQAGISPALLREGVHVHSGVARSGGRRVAELSFANTSAVTPFVLTLKQARTEALLEARVRELDPLALVRSVKVNSLHDVGTHVRLLAKPAASPAASPGSEYTARLVIGADGARSVVRQELGIATHGHDYPDTYLMGDFPDTGSDGATAVLFLEPGGIVESFPLPGGLRRWVVHTDSLLTAASASQLARLIHTRTGVAVDPEANSMLSAFNVRSRLATHMVQGRMALIGDAAHEISPIGGQGMNLGWLDAQALAPVIAAALRGESTGVSLAKFQRTRLAAARRACWQAELNMRLGRGMPASYLAVRNTAIGLAVRVPWVTEGVARRFTMT